MTETQDENNIDSQLLNAIVNDEWKKSLDALAQNPRPDINQVGRYDAKSEQFDSLFTIALRRHMFPVCDKLIEMGVDLMLPDGKGVVVRELVDKDSVIARYMQSRFAPKVVAWQKPLVALDRSKERCVG